MVSEDLPTTAIESNLTEESQGSLACKKGQTRVPKKIHKAEREKLKRDQLNELFVELGHVLEPDHQNNCKASILGDTARVLRDLFAQVDSLRKENAALLTESCYITAERNELKDENNALQSEISLLQNELQRRIQSVPLWNDTTTANSLIQPQPNTTTLPMQHQPFIIGSMQAAPVQELQLFPVERTPPTSPPGPPPQTSQGEKCGSSSTSTTSMEGSDEPGA